MKKLFVSLALIAFALMASAQSYSNATLISTAGVAKDSTITGTTTEIGGNYAVNYTAIVTADTTAMTSASVKYVAVLEGSIDGTNFGELERDTLNCDGATAGSTTAGIGSLLFKSTYPVNVKKFRLKVSTIDSTATATYTGQLQWSREK